MFAIRAIVVLALAMAVAFTPVLEAGLNAAGRAQAARAAQGCCLAKSKAAQPDGETNSHCVMHKSDSSQPAGPCPHRSSPCSDSGNCCCRVQSSPMVVPEPTFQCFSRVSSPVQTRLTSLSDQSSLIPPNPPPRCG
jgi:hypothetical protein